MKFYRQHLVKKVRNERIKGLSIKKIAQKFYISESTISRWVRDIESNHLAFKRARIKEEIWKKTSQHIIPQFRINKDIAKILLSLLYWCEGSKYPTESCISFTNSDWRLVKTFIILLRSAMKIREEKLRARLQIHTTHNYKNLLKFWSELLYIPINQFHKPTVTKPTKSMKRTDYKGTCTVKYCNVVFLLEITGIFEAFAEKYGEVPKWLKGRVC